MKKIIYAVSLTAFIFASCVKTNDLSHETVIPAKFNILQKSQKEQVQFAESNLKEIGTEIAKLAKDGEFINFVHGLVSKKFDGEYEVLIQDIFKGTTWGNNVDMVKVNHYLNEFKDIGGSNFFPQIYIPKLQNNEDKNLSTTTSNLGENNIALDSIVYIYYGGNAEADSATNTYESYPGYVLNSQGQMTYWGMVNEEYANNHEVWILSLNETVGNNAEFCPPAFINGVNQYCPESVGGCCTTGGGGDTPPGGCVGVDCDPIELSRSYHPDMGQHFPVNCKIENMVVKEHKESWLAGASEIAIRAALNCHNNLEMGSPTGVVKQYKSDQASNYLGVLIDKFKRRQVRNMAVKNVNFSLQRGWPVTNYFTDPIYFDYVIFERDIWPAMLNYQPYGVQPGRIDNFVIPYTGIASATWEQKYRSAKHGNDGWNYYYAKGSFVSNSLLAITQDRYYQTGYVNNSEIVFNTKDY